jgi:DHA1 family bicyclomycin/chloramphenicol resistance-like MFS transporter
VAERWGWQWVFIVLSAFVLVMMAVTAWVLPVGYEPDRSVELRPLPILRNYAAVLKEPQFLTYALAGSFAFAGLLVYVASSPIVFMEVFHVSAKQFGAIFAGLSVGFIGSNQINILLLKKYSSERIFLGAMLLVCPAALLLLVGTLLGWFGLWSTLVLLFVIAVGAWDCPRRTARRWRWCRSITTSAAPRPCWAFCRSAWRVWPRRASGCSIRTA